MDLRVKELCKERGMLMENLAQILGVTRITLTRNINETRQWKPCKDRLRPKRASMGTLHGLDNREINGFVEYRGTIYKIQSREDLRQLNDLVNK